MTRVKANFGYIITCAALLFVEKIPASPNNAWGISGCGKKDGVKDEVKVRVRINQSGRHFKAFIQRLYSD
jgi:hypothetical protein